MRFGRLIEKAVKLTPGPRRRPSSWLRRVAVADTFAVELQLHDPMLARKRDHAGVGVGAVARDIPLPGHLGVGAAHLPCGPRAHHLEVGIAALLLFIRRGGRLLPFLW